MDKILITGGCGFIGHHFVEHLLKNTTQEIVIFDKLTYASEGFTRLRDIDAYDDKRVMIVALDFTKEIPVGVTKEIGTVDYIMHMGAESITEDIYIPTYNSRNGTEVLTFGELWNKKSISSNIEETEKGEKIKITDKSLKVLSFYNGGQWCNVKYITRHKYKGNIIKLLQKNAILEATPNHSVYSANLELSNPSENPDLLTIRSVNEYGKQHKEENKDLLKFIAAYITEGSITKNKANGNYLIQIGQNNLNWLKDLSNSIKFLGYNNWIVERKCSNLQISNKDLFYYLEDNCGKGSQNKQIPDFIFDLKPELREYFWECLLEGDGNIEDNGNQRYTTNSKKLAAQISLLLALQNKAFTVNERDFDKEEWNRCWNFRVNIKGNQQINCGNKKIQEIEYDGWVYDLEVEDSHNFVCGIGNAVCHNTHVDNSITDPAPFVFSNVIGTMRMLDYARTLPDLKKFVYFSTDEVFGPAPEGVAYKEWDRYNSTNPYAASKACGEELVLAYANTYGIPSIISHTMNVFGERQHPEKFIPKVIRKIMNDEVITIHSNKTKTVSGSRMWIHARNVSSAIHFLLKNSTNRDKYNIVGEKEVSNLDMALYIAKILGKELKYEMVDFHSSRPGHDLRYALDGSKLTEMGWTVPLTFEKSLKNTIEWTIENPRWLEY